jgi:hypothetical protein
MKTTLNSARAPELLFLISTVLGLGKQLAQN